MYTLGLIFQVKLLEKVMFCLFECAHFSWNLVKRSLEEDEDGIHGDAHEFDGVDDQ
jgi:hypothetical protein